MKPFARELRKGQTDAEALLWHHLRNRQLLGRKFRRQQVIEPYIVDFVCFDPRLIVELDGGQPAELATHDAGRTHCLESLGYKVIRFWNHEVLVETDAVLERIHMELITSPQPSPWGRGGLTMVVIVIE